MKPLFTQKVLKEVQKANAGKWERFWEANEKKEETMTDGELLDLIIDAIKTDGEKYTDSEVLDYIERVLEDRKG